MLATSKGLWKDEFPSFFSHDYELKHRKVNTFLLFSTSHYKLLKIINYERELSFTGRGVSAS